MLRKPGCTTGAHPCWMQSVGIDSVLATRFTSSLIGALPSGTTIQSGRSSVRAWRTALKITAKRSKELARYLKGPTFAEDDSDISWTRTRGSPRASSQVNISGSLTVKKAVATGRAPAIGLRYLTNFGWMTKNRTFGRPFVTPSQPKCDQLRRRYATRKNRVQRLCGASTGRGHRCRRKGATNPAISDND